MKVSDYARELAEGRGALPPICQTLGIELADVGPGVATAVLHADQRFWNPMGTVEGGILGDLADVAMGIAFSGTLESGESFTTLEMKMNFLRPVKEGRLTGRATVVQRGKTVGMMECIITNEAGKIVAKGSSTVMVLRGAAAEGR